MKDNFEDDSLSKFEIIVRQVSVYFSISSVKSNS